MKSKPSNIDSSDVSSESDAESVDLIRSDEALIENCNDPRLHFLFGCQLHLGFASNNYAEYGGIILAHVILALLKKYDISIRTDSQLLVKQVKGLFKVKNVRITAIMPIVHDLIKHFRSVELEWVGRDNNTEADKYSKMGASQTISFDETQPDFFKIFF